MCIRDRVAPSDPWAQAASDVPADPAVRYGLLPNGMRYALLHNATPPGQASFRLRIDAGSLMERDDQKGLAHFMEHMAFNGTKDVPENEMLRILERLGLAFGADTNAFTSFDQTAYMLELPNTKDETVDPSLHILREMMSAALMAPDAIDSERGVIVGEERTRDTPQLRVLKTQLGLLAPGQRLSERLPIGDLDIIRTRRASASSTSTTPTIAPRAPPLSPLATSTWMRWRPRSARPSATGSRPPPMVPSPTWEPSPRVNRRPASWSSRASSPPSRSTGSRPLTSAPTRPPNAPPTSVAAWVWLC